MSYPIQQFKWKINGQKKFKSSDFQAVINIILYNKGNIIWPVGTRVISEKGIISFHEMILKRAIEPGSYINLQLICPLKEILEKGEYCIIGILIYEDYEMFRFEHQIELEDEIIHQSYSYAKNSKEDNELQLTIKKLELENKNLLNKIKQLEEKNKELQNNYNVKHDIVNNLSLLIKKKSFSNSRISITQNDDSQISSGSHQLEPVKNEYQKEMKGSIKINKDNNEKNLTNKENKNCNTNEKDYHRLIDNQNILSEIEINRLIEELDKKYNAKTLFEMDEIVSAIIKGKGNLAQIEDFLFQ